MSQPNNNFPPQFNFSINEPFFTWGHQDPRQEDTLPSPSASIQTTVTAPNSRSYPRSDLSRSGNYHHESRIDPSLPNFSMLAVPPAVRPRSAMDNARAPVFPSSYGGIHDEPWSTVHTRNQLPTAGRSAYPQPHIPYGSYTERPGSDINVAPKSDSGYYTHPAQSVISNEPDHVDQELPPEMTFRVGNMNVNSASSEPTDVSRIHSDQASQYSGRSTNQGKQSYKCSKCKEISKCPSDYKKHMLKHDKPHSCDVIGCRRAATGKGFTTINDLQRHKKSVHRIGVEKDSYQCASENCRNRGKIWPRLDNFKQHISRMHKGEDEQDLISRSAYQETYPPSAEEMTVAPMDTTLAGIGTEKQFPGNEIDDPVSVISLTPDQDSSQWTTYDQSSQGFAMDVDRTNTSTMPPGSSKINNSPRLNIPNQLSISIPSSTLGKRPRQDSLNILADVASTQVSPARPGPPRRHQLSNAPQTKAEQQRLALQKFSKAIVGQIQKTPSADTFDLENVVMRVLCGVTNHDRKESTSDEHSTSSSHGQSAKPFSDVDVVMTKAEALKASQAISNLIRQSGAPQYTSRTRRPSKGFSSSSSSPSNLLPCKLCSAILSRSCDMKKHMKRHTKPYGCTYPKCHKRFGAKSDWKRHENSQHFQLETFRCQQPGIDSKNPCGELFYRAEAFKSHLKTEHRITQESLIQRDIKMHRIGKNGQGQFWCGFCKEIVRLKEKRNAAWDERFDHIDVHFNKEKKAIEEWLCVEARRKKGEVLKEMDRTNFDEEDMEEYGVGETDEGSPTTGDTSEESTQTTGDPVPLTASLLASRNGPTPIDAHIQPPAPKRRRREVELYCCACHNGPWSNLMYTNCIECNHQFCPSCTGLDGGMVL